MNYKEYSFTASEITQLEYILSMLPESRVVERIGLEYRLKKVRQSLEGVPIPPRPKLVNVAFEGEPVVGGTGLDASFAGKSIRAFAESTALATAHDAGQLKDAGTIPYKELSQQLISGVSHGSFGFQIELPQDTVVDRATGRTGNPAENAVELIQDLLETALQGTDDELAEMTSRTHPRVVRKVGEFLEY